jgi:hypothetical protein
MDEHVKFIAKDLDEFQEVVSVLENFSEDNGRVTLLLHVRTMISLPADKKIIDFLKRNVGRKIGVLRTDNKRIPYVVRNIEEVDE